MPRQSKSKKVPKDLEQLVKQLIPQIAAALAGDEVEESVIEASFRAGTPKRTKSGKLGYGIEKAEIDVHVLAKIYRVRDDEGTRQRMSITLTGPVLAEKSKRSDKKAA